MFDISRELLAYAIIGTVIVVGMPFLVVAQRRRYREKLRRRGDKRYGH